MTTFVIILLATLIFGGQMLVIYHKKRKKVDMLLVEAGPTTNAKEDFTKKVPVIVGNMQMNPSYQYFKVVNDCMKMRHISSGDVIGVQPLNENYTINDINQGDILLIYLNDERFSGHKIRVMKDIVGDAFNTYYFVGDTKQQSSEPHPFSTIRGVVKEVYHPYKSVM